MLSPTQQYTCGEFPGFGSIITFPALVTFETITIICNSSLKMGVYREQDSA